MQVQVIISMGGITAANCKGCFVQRNKLQRIQRTKCEDGKDSAIEEQENNSGQLCYSVCGQ